MTRRLIPVLLLLIHTAALAYGEADDAWDHDSADGGRGFMYLLLLWSPFWLRNI